MQLESLKGCKLRIGKYPYFVYDARGGGGYAETNLKKRSQDSHLEVKFNPTNFSIPAINWRTTKFLYLPLPPGLEININVDKLEGFIEHSKGIISLQFESRFIFRIFNLYSFPELQIKTTLSSNFSKDKICQSSAESIQKDGKCTLIGASIIPATGNKLLDLFLGLPNDALAILHCKVTI